jgi:hypothetical protein
MKPPSPSTMTAVIPPSWVFPFRAATCSAAMIDEPAVTGPGPGPVIPSGNPEHSLTRFLHLHARPVEGRGTQR